MNATAKGRNEGEKKPKYVHELNCLCLLFLSSAKPYISLLYYLLLNYEQDGKLWENERKTIRETLHRIRIQGWLFFSLTHNTHSHILILIHSVCQYDLIFQTTQSNFKVIFVISVVVVGFCAKVRLNHICTQEEKEEEEEGEASLSMIWRIFRLQQSHIHSSNNQHTNIFCRKWNANLNCAWNDERSSCRFSFGSLLFFVFFFLLSFFPKLQPKIHSSTDK